jgi:hypothetical protein
MNKQLLTTTFFSMLVVSCGTISPSSSSSTNSTITSINSSSEVSESNRKVPFNQIGSLVAQVVDAKAMGIVNSKDRPQVNGRRNVQGKDQNYMVKITETYNPNTQITEDQTIQVTFTRVTNTQTTELQTGTSTHVATADPVTIERITDLPGNIIITNIEGYEYRLLSEGEVIQDWLSSNQETVEFIFDSELTGITVESRSLNASISFIAFEGFEYTIKQGETIIHEDLEDNETSDTNEAVGNITLIGLIEGLIYDVTYEGYQVIETITQDEIEGQVDKLYVLYQYTFISFVPIGTNERPKNENLTEDNYGFEGNYLYDAVNYFSSPTRLSFIFDNNTGLLYPIQGFEIERIKLGLVYISGSSFPHDVYVNETKNLVFEPIFQNGLIVNGGFEALRDKFGNKIVMNGLLKTFDSNSKTLFTDQGQFHLTSRGEIVNLLTESVYLEYLTEIPFSKTEIYEMPNNQKYLFKINNGQVYYNELRGIENSFTELYVSIGVFNERKKELSPEGLYLNKYLMKYGVLIEMADNNLYIYKNFWVNFDNLPNGIYNKNTLIEIGEFNRQVLLLDCTVLNYHSPDFKIYKIGINGNDEYKIVLNKFDLDDPVSIILKDSIVALPTSVILQPINR